MTIFADCSKLRLECRFNEVSIVLVCPSDEEARLTHRALAEAMQGDEIVNYTIHLGGRRD
jgi:hypothetical protein